MGTYSFTHMSKHKFVRIEAHHINAVSVFVHENFCKRGLEPLGTMLSDDGAEYTDTPKQIKKWSNAYMKAGHSWMICDEATNQILAVSLNFLRKAPLNLTLAEKLWVRRNKLLQYVNNYAYYQTVEMKLLKKLGSYSYYSDMQRGSKALFIQLVATSSNHKRQGLARKLINHVIEKEKTMPKLRLFKPLTSVRWGCSNAWTSKQTTRSTTRLFRTPAVIYH